MHELLFRYVLLFALSCGPSACSRDAQTEKIQQNENKKAPAKTSQTKTQTKAPSKEAPHLTLSDNLVATPTGERDPALFYRGEEITLITSIRGYQSNTNQEAKLFGTLSITSADHRVFWQQEALALTPGKTPPKKVLRIAAKAKLPADFPAGKYNLVFRLEDRIAKTKAKTSFAFELKTAALPSAKKLSIEQLKAVDTELSSGTVLPLSFVIAGLSQKADNLKITTSISDSSNIVITKKTKTLSIQKRNYPRERILARHDVFIPKNAKTGTYRASVSVETTNSQQKSSPTDYRFAINDKSFAIVNPHLHDLANLPRSHFHLGESLNLRFSIIGFQTIKKKKARVALDLAIAGPGGVFYAKKDAFVVDKKNEAIYAKAGRIPFEQKLQLPTLAYTDSYRIVIRARDLLRKKTISRVLRFVIEGKAPKLKKDFAIDKLDVRRRNDLPKEKGASFIAGQSYLLSAYIAPGNMKKTKKTSYHFSIRADLRLRLPTGAVVFEKKNFFAYDGTKTYLPLRLKLDQTWTVPNLPIGLYDLELSFIAPKENRVSTLRRRIEIKHYRAKR